MEPGEGKTLSIAMAGFASALLGKGVHLHTFNDYLAERDAEQMGRVFSLLGLSVGIRPNAENSYNAKGEKISKQAAYRSDVTYGSKEQFVYDFLKDQQVSDKKERAQRPEAPGLVVVDEGDSVLLDEAGTPLVIAELEQGVLESNGRREKMYLEVYRAADEFHEGEDYKLDKFNKDVELTPPGLEKGRQALKELKLQEAELKNLMQQALVVRHFYERKSEYMIQDEKIVLVDEFTGRLKETHILGNHQHQLIAAKERIAAEKAGSQESVKIQPDIFPQNMITYQNYYRMVKKQGAAFSMITGTMGNDTSEIRDVYGLKYARIPLQHKSTMKKNPPVITQTKEEKDEKMIEKIKEIHARGNPIVIFVRRISDVEHLEERLKASGLSVETLHGASLEAEAKILSRAGEEGHVTIVTNVAGRGVNIGISENAKKLGGLHVILTKLHTSRRIDDQQELRAARSGEPGESHMFLSLEDEAFQRFGGLEILEDRAKNEADFEELRRKIQGNGEAYLRASRQRALSFDDILNDYRTNYYEQRDRVLDHALTMRPMQKSILLKKIDDAWRDYLGGLEEFKYEVDPGTYQAESAKRFETVLETLDSALRSEMRTEEPETRMKKVTLAGIGFKRFVANPAFPYVLIPEAIDERALVILQKFGKVNFDVLDPGTEGKRISNEELLAIGVAKKREGKGYAIILGFVNHLLGKPAEKSKEFLRAFPDLEAINLFSRGFGHVDLDLAAKNGIVVTNIGDMLTQAMAELNIGNMLEAHYDLLNTLHDNPAEGRQTLESLDLNPDSSAQILWGRLLAKTLKLKEMYEFGKSDRFNGAGVAPMDTVLHEQLAKNDYAGIHPAIGFIAKSGKDAVLERLARIGQAHEIAQMFYYVPEAERLPEEEERKLGLTYVSSVELLLQKTRHAIRLPGAPEITAAAENLVDPSRLYVNPQDKAILNQSLQEKILGIQSYGSISQAVAKRALSLGMKVNALVRNKSEKQEKYPKGVTFFEAGDSGETKTFLNQAQILTLLAPESDETRNFIRAGTLAELKNLKILINTGRGGLINEDDFYQYLIDHPDVLARLDVLRKESGVPDQKFSRLSNVQIGGHTGSAVLDIRFAMQRNAIEGNLIPFLESRPSRKSVFLWALGGLAAAGVSGVVAFGFGGWREVLLSAVIAAIIPLLFPKSHGQSHLENVIVKAPLWVRFLSSSYFQNAVIGFWFGLAFTAGVSLLARVESKFRSEARAALGGEEVVRKINSWSAEEFFDRMRAGYESGLLKRTSNYKDWEALKTKQKKNQGVGVLVFRKIGVLWHILLALQTSGDSKDFYVVPSGRLDKKKNPRFEKAADINELIALNIADENDRKTKEQESVPAAGLRELFEETGIRGRIAGRFNDSLFPDKALRMSYFIHIDESDSKEIGKGNGELVDPVWIPLWKILLSKDAQIGEVVEKSLPEKGRLLEGAKRSGFIELKQILMALAGPQEKTEEIKMEGRTKITRQNAQELLLKNEYIWHPKEGVGKIRLVEGNQGRDTRELKVEVVYLTREGMTRYKEYNENDLWDPEASFLTATEPEKEAFDNLRRDGARKRAKKHHERKERIAQNSEQLQSISRTPYDTPFVRPVNPMGTIFSGETELESIQKRRDGIFHLDNASEVERKILSELLGRDLVTKADGSAKEIRKKMVTRQRAFLKTLNDALDEDGHLTEETMERIEENIFKSRIMEKWRMFLDPVTFKPVTGKNIQEWIRNGFIYVEWILKYEIEETLKIGNEITIHPRQLPRSEARQLKRPGEWSQGVYRAVRIGGAEKQGSRLIPLEDLRYIAIPRLSFKVQKDGDSYGLQFFDGRGWNNLIGVDVKKDQPLRIGRVYRPSDDENHASTNYKNIRNSQKLGYSFFDMDPKKREGRRIAISWNKDGRPVTLYLPPVFNEKDLEEITRMDDRQPGHLELRLLDENLEITDLGSRNGTFVERKIKKSLIEGQKTSPGGKPRPLNLNWEMIPEETVALFPGTDPLIAQQKKPFEIFTMKGIEIEEREVLEYRDGKLFRQAPKTGAFQIERPVDADRKKPYSISMENNGVLEIKTTGNPIVYVRQLRQTRSEARAQQQWEEKITAVKEMLGKYFKEEEFENALILFGDILVRNPERIPFADQLLQALKKARGEKPLQKDDYRDLLGWIQREMFARKEIAVFLDDLLQEGIRYDQFPKKFVEIIVKYRIPKRNFKAAYLAWMAAQNPEGLLNHKLLRKLYQQKVQKPYHKGPFADATVPGQGSFKMLPRQGKDLFSLGTSIENGEKWVVFRLEDRTLANQLKAAGFKNYTALEDLPEPYPQYYPYLYYVLLGRFNDRLLINTHQLMMHAPSDGRKANPELDRFLKTVPETALNTLIRQLDKVLPALDLGDLNSIRELRMVSPGKIVQEWPWINTATAIQYYFDFPKKSGFKVIERTPEELANQPDRPAGVWYWNQDLAVFQNIKRSEARSKTMSPQWEEDRKAVNEFMAKRVRSEARTQIRKELFEDAFLHPLQFSDEARHAIFSLFPQPVLDSLNVKEADVVWATNGQMDLPKEKVIVRVWTDDQSMGGRSLQIRLGEANHADKYAAMQLQEESGDRLLIGGGRMDEFLKATQKYPEFAPRFAKFAWWIDLNVVDFARALGFRQLRLKQASAPEDLIKAGWSLEEKKKDDSAIMWSRPVDLQRSEARSKKAGKGKGPDRSKGRKVVAEAQTAGVDPGLLEELGVESVDGLSAPVLSIMKGRPASSQEWIQFFRDIQDYARLHAKYAREEPERDKEWRKFQKSLLVFSKLLIRKAKEDTQITFVLNEVSGSWDAPSLGGFLQHFILTYKEFMEPRLFEEMQKRLFKLVSGTGNLEGRLQAWWIYAVATVYHLRHYGLHVEIAGSGEVKAIDQELLKLLMTQYFLPDYFKWRQEYQAEIGSENSAAWKLNRSMLWALGLTLDYRIYDSESANYDYEMENAMRRFRGQPPYRADAAEAFPGGAQQSMMQLLQPILEALTQGGPGLLNEILELNRQDTQNPGAPSFSWQSVTPRPRSILPLVLSRGEGLSKLSELSRKELSGMQLKTDHTIPLLVDTIDQYKVDPFKALREAAAESLDPAAIIRQLVKQTQKEHLIDMPSVQADLGELQKQLMRQGINTQALKDQEELEKILPQESLAIVEKISHLLKLISTPFYKKPLAVSRQPLGSFEDIQPGAILGHDNHDQDPEKRLVQTYLVLERMSEENEVLFLTDVNQLLIMSHEEVLEDLQNFQLIARGNSQSDEEKVAEQLKGIFAMIGALQKRLDPDINMNVSPEELLFLLRKGLIDSGRQIIPAITDDIDLAIKDASNRLAPIQKALSHILQAELLYSLFANEEGRKTFLNTTRGEDGYYEFRNERTEFKMHPINYDAMKELIQIGKIEGYIPKIQEIQNELVKARKEMEVLLQGRSEARKEGRGQEMGVKLLVQHEFFPGYFNVLKNFFKKAFADIFAFVHGNYRGPAVGVAKINVAAFLANFFKSKFSQNADDLVRLKGSKAGQLGDLDFNFLNADKPKGFWGVFFDREAKLNGFFDSWQKLFHGFGLGMAALQARYRGYQQAVFIFFNQSQIFNFSHKLSPAANDNMPPHQSQDTRRSEARVSEERLSEIEHKFPKITSLMLEDVLEGLASRIPDIRNFAAQLMGQIYRKKPEVFSKKNLHFALDILKTEKDSEISRKVLRDLVYFTGPMGSKELGQILNGNYERSTVIALLIQLIQNKSSLATDEVYAYLNGNLRVTDPDHLQLLWKLIEANEKYANAQSLEVILRAFRDWREKPDTASILSRFKKNRNIFSQENYRLFLTLFPMGTANALEFWTCFFQADPAEYSKNGESVITQGILPLLWRDDQPDTQRIAAKALILLLQTDGKLKRYIGPRAEKILKSYKQEVAYADILSKLNQGQKTGVKNEGTEYTAEGGFSKKRRPRSEARVASERPTTGPGTHQQVRAEAQSLKALPAGGPVLRKWGARFADILEMPKQNHDGAIHHLLFSPWMKEAAINRRRGLYHMLEDTTENMEIYLDQSFFLRGTEKPLVLEDALMGMAHLLMDKSLRWRKGALQPHFDPADLGLLRALIRLYNDKTHPAVLLDLPSLFNLSLSPAFKSIAAFINFSKQLKFLPRKEALEAISLGVLCFTIHLNTVFDAGSDGPADIILIADYLEFIFKNLREPDLSPEEREALNLGLGSLYLFLRPFVIGTIKFRTRIYDLPNSIENKIRNLIFENAGFIGKAMDATYATAGLDIASGTHLYDLKAQDPYLIALRWRFFIRARAVLFSGAPSTSFTETEVFLRRSNPEASQYLRDRINQTIDSPSPPGQLNQILYRINSQTQGRVAKELKEAREDISKIESFSGNKQAFETWRKERIKAYAAGMEPFLRGKINFLNQSISETDEKQRYKTVGLLNQVLDLDDKNLLFDAMQVLLNRAGDLKEAPGLRMTSLNALIRMAPALKAISPDVATLSALIDGFKNLQDGIPTSGNLSDLQRKSLIHGTQDILNALAPRSEARSKFVKGLIFDRAFVESERKISAIHKTVVFDLDHTLIGNSETEEMVLRPGIEEQLEKLREKGIRLVLWTSASRVWMKTFLKKHPQMLDLFDRFISRKNSMLQTEADGESMIRIYGNYKAGEKIDYRLGRLNATAEAARNYYRSDKPYAFQVKDISLLGYSLLVDNSRQLPLMAQESPSGVFKYYQIKPFRKDVPDEEPIHELADKILKMLEEPSLETRSEARSLEMPFDLKAAETLAKFTLGVLLLRVAEKLQRSELRQAIEHALDRNIAYAMSETVKADPLEQLGEGPVQFTREFLSSMQEGAGYQIVEYPFLKLLMKSPADLRRQLEVYEKIQGGNAEPVAVTFLPEGVTQDAFMKEILKALGQKSAGISDGLRQKELAKRIGMKIPAENQNEEKAMADYALEKQGRVAIIGLGTKAVPGLLKFAVQEEDMERLVNLPVVFYYMAGILKIAHELDLKLQADTIERLTAKYLQGMDQVSGNVFVLKRIAELALRALSEHAFESAA